MPKWCARCQDRPPYKYDICDICFQTLNKVWLAPIINLDAPCFGKYQEDPEHNLYEANLRDVSPPWGWAHANVDGVACKNCGCWFNADKQLELFENTDQDSDDTWTGEEDEPFIG